MQVSKNPAPRCPSTSNLPYLICFLLCVINTAASITFSIIIISLPPSQPSARASLLLLAAHLPGTHRSQRGQEVQRQPPERIAETGVLKFEHLPWEAPAFRLKYLLKTRPRSHFDSCSRRAVTSDLPLSSLLGVLTGRLTHLCKYIARASGSITVTVRLVVNGDSPQFLSKS